MPPILVYERNKAYVMEQFHNGHFDYVEVVQEVAQRDFFRYVASQTLLERLAETYPSRRLAPLCRLNRQHHTADVPPQVHSWLRAAASLAPNGPQPRHSLPTV